MSYPAALHILSARRHHSDTPSGACVPFAEFCRAARRNMRYTLSVSGVRSYSPNAAYHSLAFRYAAIIRTVMNTILNVSLALAATFGLLAGAAGQKSPPAGGGGIAVRGYSWSREIPGLNSTTIERGVPGPAVDAHEGGGVPPLSGGLTTVPKAGYRYRVKVENVGRREARAVVWEYRVTEKATREVTAHRFRSELRLRPGARADLKEFSREQPSGVVSADSGGRKYREAFEEAVVILRVEYEDGGAWEPR